MEGISITKGFSINAAKHADSKVGVFENIAQALETPREYRPLGLTVYIIGTDGVEEYWWKTGTLDTDLVKKNPDDAATTVTFNTSGTLDLSGLKTYNIFYIYYQGFSGDTVTINKIIAPHDKEFLLIFISPSGTTYNVIVKHVNGILNCGGLDNEFITNGSNWWLGKKTHNTDEVWQRNANSTKEVIPDGTDPNLNGEVIFVEYLPDTGLENALYVVTSVTPNIAFRWTGSAFIKVGNYDSHLRYQEVKGIRTTAISDLTQCPNPLNGYTLGIGDRVLYANQTNATRNGIFVVTAVQSIAETATLERVPISVNQYKTTIAKVVEGNHMKQSVWLFDMRASVNKSWTSYKEPTGFETTLISINTKCIYNPEDIDLTIAGEHKAVIYIDGDGNLTATAAPSADSVLVVKNGNPEWIQGTVGKDLYVGNTGLQFALPRPYTINTLSTDTFNLVGSLPQVAHAKFIDVESHEVYTINCELNANNVAIAFNSLLTVSPGYIKTFRFKSHVDSPRVTPIIAGFIGSLTLENIQLGASQVIWVDGIPPDNIQAGEQLIVYMSIYGVTNADIICSWAMIEAAPTLQPPQ